MRDHETAAIKAEALRDFASKHADLTTVLYRDLDRGIDVRVSTLAWDAAERYDEEARQAPETDAGCVECGRPVDRTLPAPIPEGYECMWSEAMCGRALYCHACYDGTTPTGDADA